uniref:SH2 domain-containing protein n=1 Tax=Steinernema glaseri TaxID=37863 RepID=A0A1I7YXF1_9BILA
MVRRDGADDGADDSCFVYEVPARPTKLDSDVYANLQDVISDVDTHNATESSVEDGLPISSVSTVLDSEIVFGPCRRRLEEASWAGSDSEQESEIVFCTDSDLLEEIASDSDSPPEPISDVAPFFCSTTVDFHEQMNAMEPGDFRLYSTHGDAKRKEEFAIGYKTISGAVVRFDVARTSTGRKLFHVESVDSESPMFPSLASLVSFYAMNSVYFSLRFKKFIRFPVGSVMKKERVQRNVT